MTEALLISNVLLWVVVLVLAAVVVALLRQIGVLHERVAPAGALVTGGGPKVGEPAPVLEVEDLAGRRLRLGEADPDGRSTLLFFLSPGCPVCKALLPAVHSLRSSEGDELRVIFASDGPESDHREFVRSAGLEGESYVLSTALGLAWQVAALPTAALIDAAGIVRARGLVNTREHLESLFEARDHGIASVQEYLARRRAAGDDAA